MKEKKDIVKSFINHLGNASVMDLLLKVIACGDIADGAGTLEVVLFCDHRSLLVAVPN